MAKARMWIKKLGLLSLLLFSCGTAVTAQICGPAQLKYIVRDSKGKIVDASTLGESSFTGEKAKYWKRVASTVSFTEPGKNRKPVEVKSLTYSGGGDCHLQVDEVTIKMDGKSMHLIFGRSLQTYPSGSFGYQVIDSLPFQQGTFKLEDSSEENVPASKWKKVSSKP